MSIRIKRGILLCSSFSQANTLINNCAIFHCTMCASCTHATPPLHPCHAHSMPPLHSYHTPTTPMPCPHCTHTTPPLHSCHAPTALIPHPHYTHATCPHCTHATPPLHPCHTPPPHPLLGSYNPRLLKLSTSWPRPSPRPPPCKLVHPTNT